MLSWCEMFGFYKYLITAVMSLVTASISHNLLLTQKPYFHFMMLGPTSKAALETHPDITWYRIYRQALMAAVRLLFSICTISRFGDLSIFRIILSQF